MKPYTLADGRKAHEVTFEEYFADTLATLWIMIVAEGHDPNIVFSDPKEMKGFKKTATQAYARHQKKFGKIGGRRGE